MSEISAKGELARYSIIRSAFFAPMPGSIASSSRLAVLILITPFKGFFATAASARAGAMRHTSVKRMRKVFTVFIGFLLSLLRLEICEYADHGCEAAR